MGKGKLAKFAEMARMEHVFEFPIRYWRGGESEDSRDGLDSVDNVDKIDNIDNSGEGGNDEGNGVGGGRLAAAFTCPLRGHWGEQVFHNSNPIVLELGCGRGEYCVGLARLHPDMNFIGVDIKGARMWTGAREAEAEGLKNVAFLRTNIEFIQLFFAPGEVAGIWLTFSDPQMKKVTKRLSSTYFLKRYSQFLGEGGIIHLKTDSNFLFTYTEELLKANGIAPLACTRDLYSEDRQGLFQAAQSIQTYYETMWMGRGIPIKYLAFALTVEPHTLVEPNVEIPLDEYRSYSRDKRSAAEKHV